LSSNLGGQSAIILKEGTARSQGREAQHANITAALVIAESVRSSLGPKGMDKMLVDGFGDVTISNDGATILDEMDVQHPAAKMMVEVAKTQDDEVGDGTTSVVVLAGELLSKAKALIDRDVHPTMIVDGYQAAGEQALEFLGRIAITVNPPDIKVEKKPGGSLTDTALIQGIVLDKEVVHPGMPRRVENAKTAFLTSPLQF